MADQNLNSNMRFERAGASLVVFGGRSQERYNIEDNSNLSLNAQSVTDLEAATPTWDGPFDTANDPDGYPGGTGIYDAAQWARDWTVGAPGHSRLRHFAFISHQVTNGLTYWSFDHFLREWSGPTVIVADVTSFGMASFEEGSVAITEVEGGNIYVLAYAAGNPLFYMSDDDGATWQSKSVVGLPTPTTSNYCYTRITGGPFADTNDLCALIMNGDDDTWKAYQYDVSADSWSAGVSVTSGGHDAGTGLSHAMSMVQRSSDRAILLATCNDVLSATGSLITGTLTGEGPQVFTAGADVYSNNVNSYFCALTLDENDDSVYCIYCGSDDDSEAGFSVWRTYYKKSVDGMASWSAQSQMHETADDLRGLSAPLKVREFMNWHYAPLTHNDDLNDLLAPLVNDFSVDGAVENTTLSDLITGEADLEAYWPLGEPETPTADDRSPNSNDLTTGNVTRGLYPFNRGGDGSIEGVGSATAVSTTGAPASLANLFSGGATLFCIIRPQAVSLASDTVGNVINKAQWLLRTQDASGDNMRLNFVQGHSVQSGQWGTDQNVPKNVLTIFALTYDRDSVGNDPEMHISIDGAPRTKLTIGSGITELFAPIGTPSDDTASILHLFARSGPLDRFVGGIDEVALWSSIKSDAYIDSLFAAALPITVTATLSGDVVPTVSEEEMVAGEQTVKITLSGGTWESTIPGDNVLTYEVLKGFRSTELAFLFGWEREVRGRWLDEVIAAKSPAVYYRLNETTGTTAADSSGNGIDGTYLLGPLIGEPSFVERDPATCMDPINISNSARMEVSAVAGIANVFGGGGSAQILMFPRSDGGTNAGRLIQKGSSWGLYVTDEVAGFCRLAFVHTFSGTDGLWHTDRNIPLNAASVVTVGYDKDDPGNDPSIWVDDNVRVVGGGLTRVTTPTGTAQDDSGDDLLFGNTVAFFIFDGRLAHASLWNSVLGIADIRDIVDAAFEPGGITYENFTSLSSTELEIKFPARPDFQINRQETITLTLPDEVFA